ncbi:MAG: SurA N-terminal domain-containing protein [Syntrophales bacterium]|nr:SurA N-terminal domain-containing protein [Syntrophales bacterium]
MENKNCEKCGKEISGAGEVLCPECKEGVRRKSGRRLWYSGIAVVLLLLAGAGFLYAEKQAWEFSWDVVLGRPAAVVNGESISRSEARSKLNVSRLMLEKEYGKGLFAGEQGRALLGRLERDVLEKMVEERLVAREASRLKIKVGDDLVQQEIKRIEKIGREIYGNDDNFQASLKEDGISQEYLVGQVRNLLLFQEVKKAKAPPQADSEAYFAEWLTQDRKAAKVAFNQTVPPAPSLAQGEESCCGAGGGSSAGVGGCGTKQAPGALDPKLQSTASVAALDAYRGTHPAEQGLEAKVTDYGCHVQVDIEKGGKIVASYSYRDGKVSEI